ncbi:hypothetical protein BJV78DRAFT_1228317 [Lactifluus subvellereus]|nr:hypothetical protein BJV78DRAFT_1228317 [Lactifluus subvellereus]
MDRTEIAALRDFVTVVKVLHFIDGVKAWNILSNLDFDWRLLHRKPAPAMASIVYLAERLASLACAVSFVVGLNVSSRINCQAWISISFLFPLVELELALVLIALRVIAIWGCSKSAILLTTMTLSMHSVVSIYLLTGVRAFWDPGPDYYKGCVMYTTRTHLLLMSIMTIIAYTILLVTMLIGLLRHGQARSSGIWTLLFQQGWIWFALAVVAEVPTLALVLANVNRSIHLLLQVPRVVIASLGTTAMFRVLYTYPKHQEAIIPINTLRISADTNTALGSTSHPFTGNDLQISVVTSTTVGCDDVSYQKRSEGLHL